MVSVLRHLVTWRRLPRVSLALKTNLNIAANLPAEVQHLFEEIAAKDKLFLECLNIIEQRDGSLHRFIRTNGSLTHNPKEDLYNKTILDEYAKAKKLQDEKIALANKALGLVKKYEKRLVVKMRGLYKDGLLVDDPMPNGPPIGPVRIGDNAALSNATRSNTPAQVISGILSTLEGEAGGDMKRRRASTTVGVGGSTPRNPKGFTPEPSGTIVTQGRSGSVSNRATPLPTGPTSLKRTNSSANVTRKGTQRKRLKKEAVGAVQTGETPATNEEDDAAEDNRVYCFCKQVSYGDMVGCDNENCKYEWFHWGKPLHLYYCYSSGI